ncbi:hypothetical protein GR160_08625 [Flavobacterium sp. Sd200]|uniref:hypothetical protein n=1 Tax=Flavobacterium sp. Sd200 TaxID=2692211 RepID=UPI00136F88CC|nr:hypothetical protein [Flavobacterium sp. Sd200]MXN91292.1 hypothetical protein [Flavobacterium sp. Sd200]
MQKFMFFIVLLCSLSGNAQINYPGTMPELLKGKTVKVISTKTAENLGYPDFYTNITSEQTERYMPAKSASLYTEATALRGQTFKVTAIDKITRFGEVKTRLTLEGANSLKLYYIYNEKFDYGYPFEVIGGLAVPDGFYCRDKTVHKGQFGTTEEVATGDGSSVSKDIDSDGTTYAVYLILFGARRVNPVSEATLVLEKGETLTVKTNDIAAEFVKDKSYRYHVLFSPKGELVDKLKAKKITSVIVDDLEMPIATGQKIQGVVNCLFQ